MGISSVMYVIFDVRKGHPKSEVKVKVDVIVELKVVANGVER